jgi:subtilase family serine protease
VKYFIAHSVRPRSRQRWACPGVELLESRNLLSAVEPVVQPLLSVEPLVLNGHTPYSPAQISHAYGFDQVALGSSAGQSTRGDGSGQTIAIVEMYDDPSIAGDLHVFDQHFGLSDPRLVKVAPQGTPSVNTLWAMETSLDVEWAHALAPKATILLVEAGATSTSLLIAVNYARNYPGVSVVSMSWGDPEFAGESYYDSYFTTPAGHAPVTFVASSGDYGASPGPLWPAVSPNVLAVGGTSLYLTSAGNYSSEVAWSGSTGGYSGSRFHYTSHVAEPAYQYSAQHTGYRSSPDVSFDADRNTGYWIYDSAGSYGWMEVGGTSAGPPQWSALIAIANQGRGRAGSPALSRVPADVYSLPTADFHDVTRGGNGYAAHAGYDLVTGLGTPIANLIVRDLASAEGTAVRSGSGTTTTTTGLTVSVNIPINQAIQGDRANETCASLDAGGWWRTTAATLGRRSREPNSLVFGETSLPSD